MNGVEQEIQREHLHRVCMEKELIVCCGAGGVGKTTTAAAIGVGAALLGRRVLVLTIDPARRLADALGVEFTSSAPQSISPSLFSSVGATLKGELSVWMLQPGEVFDSMVRELSSDPDDAERLFSLSLYQAIRQLIAGMQEYMAGESLYQFHKSGAYDLIILDTPPSRNAIDFLTAPERILDFLDSRILRIFSPKKGGWSLLSRARSVVQKTFGLLAGSGFLAQAQEFVGLFLGIFDQLKDHAAAVQSMLASEKASHFLVTSPDPLAFEEALFFRRILRERAIPFGGFLLNRSLANHPTALPGKDILSEEGALGEGFAKLASSMVLEKGMVAAHGSLVEKLKNECEGDAFAFATPHLGKGIEDLEGLLRLAAILFVPASFPAESFSHVGG